MSDETTIEVTVSEVVADAIRGELGDEQPVRAVFHAADGFVIGEGVANE